MRTIFEEFKNYESWVKDEDNRPGRTAHDPSATNQNDWFQCSFLSFGDYDHSCEIERSNVRVFMERYGDLPEVKKEYFAYGSEVIYIKGTCKNEDLIEDIINLYNYPILDEEDCSEMRIELEQECWEAYGQSDFERALLKHFEADDIEPIEGTTFFDLYLEAAEKTNTYPEVEAGGSMCFYIDRVIEAVDENKLRIEVY